MNFKVGDRVVEVDGDRLISSSKVKSVGVRKMVLENGRVWNADGSCPWGQKTNAWYNRTHLRLRVEADDALITRQNLMRRLKAVNWELLTTAAMDDVWAILECHLPKKEPK